ncbi:MAG: septum formation initiator family protein [Ghiorsea sp.]|nr:septum formation initiator family protein [Ghiorsea sp.]
MKRLRQWLFYSFGLIITILMFWDLTFSEHGYFVFQQEKETMLQLQKDIKSLQIEKVRLQKEIIRLREEPEALEFLIRQELGYVYPDETMIIMPKR